jgi:hypothetical protein
MIASQQPLACAGPFGVETINARLMDPEVQAALSGAAQVFGLDRRANGGGVDHIEVNGSVLIVGDTCTGDPTCNIPEGVANLDHLLAQLQMIY